MFFGLEGAPACAFPLFPRLPVTTEGTNYGQDIDGPVRHELAQSLTECDEAARPSYARAAMHHHRSDPFLKDRKEKLSKFG